MRVRSHPLATLLLAGTLSLLLAAAAGAVIYVYGNNFESVGSFREIERSNKGSQCDKSYRHKSNSMRVTVVGRRLCDYVPPVEGDRPQPDHVVLAKGKMLPKRTPKALRDDAYLAVKVRAGGGNAYEFQVRAERRFRLVRNPTAGGLSQAGRNGAIKALRNTNVLRLSVKGGRVTGYVNGERVATFLDPNPGQLDGRKVAFGLGSGKDSDRETVGSFGQVRVGIAD